MREPERAPRYRKDEQREAQLRALNASLAPLQEILDADLTSPRLPVLFVIGTPRSGSTLLGQLLAHSGLVGYVSNFVARFWRAPMIGARIETALGIRDTPLDAPFASEHGLTQGWSAPHEFGYFWDQWFDQGQDTHKLTREQLARIDAASLRRRVASIESVYGMPMSFKNNTWCSLQADWLASTLPTASFIVCRRDPVYVAQSLAMARRARLGSEEAWWSMRPSTFERIRRLPWWEQVAAQALELERELDAALAPIAVARKLEVRYAALCAAPRRVAQAVADQLVAAGVPPRPLATLPESFERTDAQRLGDDEWRRIVGAVKRLGEEGLPA